MKIEKLTRKSHNYNEDRIIIGNSFYMVMDGATSLIKGNIKPTEGSWLVSFVKKNLRKNCKDVKETLNRIAKKAYEEFIRLSRVGNPNINVHDVLYYPSAGISWAEIKEDKVFIYTIGDCEAVVKAKNGQIIRHVNLSLPKLDKYALDSIVKIKEEKNISVKEAVKLCQNVLVENRTKMNEKGGYSIYTVDDAPDFDYSETVYDIADVKEIYLYTDGITQAFDELKIYSSCEEMFTGDVDIEKEIEKIKDRAYKDKDCNLYPRFKTIDDIAIIKIKF